MRLTRRPPPFVAVLVWAVAFACLVYGTLSRSALPMPNPGESEPAVPVLEDQDVSPPTTPDSP